MVFHAIDKCSITELISEHRIIIYYIEGIQANARLDEGSKTRLFKTLESVMEMLKKKNDDLILVKVLNDSMQFSQFEELYKPEVSGAVTLFAVNNVGIPIKCEQINREDDILNVIKSLSESCKLNCIKNIEIPKFTHIVAEQEITPKVTTVTVAFNSCKTTGTHSSSPLHTEENILDNGSFAVRSGACNESENRLGESQPNTTELQIRLPNGNRDKQKFDREAMLQEVWIFISVKYKLKNFDLKTYNQQVFSEVEYEKSLQDLDLCPNGVIIVVDKNVASFNSSPNEGIGAMIRLGFYHLTIKTFSLFGYVQGLFIMFWNSLFFSNDRDGRPKQNQVKSSLKGSVQQSSSERETKKQSSSKTFGNIHTLRRNDDSDDENNRYNGNSTQQK